MAKCGRRWSGDHRGENIIDQETQRNHGRNAGQEGRKERQSELNVLLRSR